MEPEEYETIARLEDQHWWYLGMRAIAARLIRAWVMPSLAARSAGPAGVLDAGCGTGGGLRWLAGLGIVTGIDVSPLALGHAAKTSPRVIRASVDALPFGASAFDLVTSFEVLYHLGVTDDAWALREFCRVLRPGGWLVLRVPAYDWLRGDHDRQVHTRHRYSRREVGHKVAAAGLELKHLTYVGLSILAPALLRRLRAAGAFARSDVTLPPPWLNRLLERLLRSEGAWLARRTLPVGLSILALARRPEE